MANWRFIRSAPKDGTSFLSYDYNGNGPTHIRWHEPWGEWVLADVLLRLEIDAPDDEPAVWHHLPEPPVFEVRLPA